MIARRRLTPSALRIPLGCLMVALRDELLPEEVDVLGLRGRSVTTPRRCWWCRTSSGPRPRCAPRSSASVLAPQELSFGAFTMLFCLWVWGPLEVRDAAERMAVSRPTVSGIADTLERRGLVERRDHETDARRRSLALTARDEEAFASCSHWSTATRAPPAPCSNPRSRPSSRGSCASSSMHREETPDEYRIVARHRGPHGRAVPRGPTRRRSRDLARRRAHRRCRLAPQARRRGPLDGHALRLPARAPRRDADAVADTGRPSTSRTSSRRARPTSSGGASRSSSGRSCTAASWAARPTT